MRMAVVWKAYAIPRAQHEQANFPSRLQRYREWSQPWRVMAAEAASAGQPSGVNGFE